MWLSPSRMLAVLSLALGLGLGQAQAVVLTNSDELPPFRGSYASEGVHGLFDFLATAGVVIEITGAQHNIPAPMVQCGEPPGSQPCGMVSMVGDMEIETFKSNVAFTATISGTTGAQTVTGTNVEAKVKITLANIIGSMRLFDAELLALELDGMLALDPMDPMSPMIPFTLREDPSRASTGQTSITDLGGGLFAIDSFFDVFTELSINNLPFVGCDPCGRMVLVSAAEPPAVAAMAGGLAVLALAGRRFRRH